VLIYSATSCGTVFDLFGDGLSRRGLCLGPAALPPQQRAKFQEVPLGADLRQRSALTQEREAGHSSELPAVLIVDDVDANLVACARLLDGVRCSVTWSASGPKHCARC